MRVLDESRGGVKSGERLDLKGAGLPLEIRRAALIVFWKGR